MVHNIDNNYHSLRTHNSISKWIQYCIGSLCREPLLLNWLNPYQLDGLIPNINSK